MNLYLVADAFVYKIIPVIIVSAHFIDGCAGNTQAVAALVKGMPVVEAVRRLKGIACQGDRRARINLPGPRKRPCEN